MRTSGLAGQRRRTSIPACLPVVDIRPAFVVFPARTAHAIFSCILHEGLPVLHILCYTLTHKGQNSFFGFVVCGNLTIPYEGSVLLLFIRFFDLYCPRCIVALQCWRWYYCEFDGHRFGSWFRSSCCWKYYRSRRRICSWNFN